MSDYREFARFYDRVMTDLEPDIDRFSAQVRGCIARYRPNASSLLELGCGTGTLLAGLPELVSVTGLDISPEMLAIARSKVPRATFIEGDMAEFELGRKFDLVVCVYDTLNHLASFDRWTSLFDCVYSHVVDDGLFIFDVNTIGGLQRLSKMPPFVHDFSGNTLIMNVELAQNGMSTWDIRIFEELKQGKFILRHERIHELGVELDRIVDALSRHFELIEMTDQSGGPPYDDSNRAYFVAKARRDVSSYRE